MLAKVHVMKLACTWRVLYLRHARLENSCGISIIEWFPHLVKRRVFSNVRLKNIALFATVPHQMWITSGQRIFKNSFWVLAREETKSKRPSWSLWFDSLNQITAPNRRLSHPNCGGGCGEDCRESPSEASLQRLVRLVLLVQLLRSSSF